MIFEKDGVRLVLVDGLSCDLDGDEIWFVDIQSGSVHLPDELLVQIRKSDREGYKRLKNELSQWAGSKGYVQKSIEGQLKILDGWNMGDKYRKYTVSSKVGHVPSFVVFSSMVSYENRRSEIFAWIERLAISAGMTDYEIVEADTSWTEATIKDDFLFEKHHPG